MDAFLLNFVFIMKYDTILLERSDIMPPARVHEAIAKKINKTYNYDEKLLRIGTIAPDCWRNVPKEAGIKDKYLSHFWDFRIKSGQANDYENFYLKYYKEINNPFYFGYLVHLMVDQYWKTFLEQKYEKKIDGNNYVILKDGTFLKNENYFSYFEEVKMQQRLANKYNLDYLPINQDDYQNFVCQIDEVNLNGLFNVGGSLDYVNKDLGQNEKVAESGVYDDESIEAALEETAVFVKKELIRLEKIKKEYDTKIKIAVDIDDTILSTKELEKYYWQIFLHEHNEIDAKKKYQWGDKELSLFWQEYREKMAYGKVKDNVSLAFKELKNKGYIVDLLSARPLDKYASLNQNLMEYFEKNNLIYDHIYIGFYSKVAFLEEHNYDILIDNELRHILAAQGRGISTILFGPFNPNYEGIQTDDWVKIPVLIMQIIEEKTKKKSL